MKSDIVQLNSDLLSPTVKGAGVRWYNTCNRVATFRDSNKFDLQHDLVLKKLSFDL